MKADIFHAYQALLKQTKPSSSSGMNGSIVQDPNSMEAEEGPIALLQAQVQIWRLRLELSRKYLKIYSRYLKLTNTAVLILYLQVPNIVKAIHRQMKEKSIKTRQGCFALLTELIIVLPGALATHMDQIIPGIQFSLGELQQ